MPEIGQYGRMAYAIGVGLFGVALAAGVVQAVRVTGRLPTIDLLGTGPKAYIDRLVAQKDYDAAIEQLDLKSRTEPPDPETYELLGKLLLRQVRPEEARASFQELVRLRPKYAEGFNGLGLASGAVRGFAGGRKVLREGRRARAGLHRGAEQPPESPRGIADLLTERSRINAFSEPERQARFERKPSLGARALNVFAFLFFSRRVYSYT